jgi:hypothetical protein
MGFARCGPCVSQISRKGRCAGAVSGAVDTLARFSTVLAASFPLLAIASAGRRGGMGMKPAYPAVLITHLCDDRGMRPPLHSCTCTWDNSRYRRAPAPCRAGKRATAATLPRIWVAALFASRRARQSTLATPAARTARAHAREPRPRPAPQWPHPSVPLRSGRHRSTLTSERRSTTHCTPRARRCEVPQPRRTHARRAGDS